MKKPISAKLQKFLLAVWFVLGGTCTFELTVERVREHTNLYAVMTLLAIVFDVLFFKCLFSLFGNKVLHQTSSVVGRFFAVIFRGIGKLCEKVSDAFAPKNRDFLEGKSERYFVFETRENRDSAAKRKLPKLAKDASEKEKIRHAYASYVFRKNKNISASLTPSEVREELCISEEDGPIFDAYNAVRYTE